MIDKYLEFIDKRKANNIYRQNKQKIDVKIDLTTNDYFRTLWRVVNVACGFSLH